MLLLERRVATPKGGRPRRDDQGRNTRQVRMAEDLAFMLMWVCKAKGVSSAVYLDPLIRASVESEYAARYQTIRKLKRLADETAEVTGEEPPPALPQLNTVDTETGEVVTLEELHQRAVRRKRKPKG